MKKTFIYGLSTLAVALVMLMQIPTQAATNTTTTTCPSKAAPAHKKIVQPVKKVVTKKDKGSTIKNITETKTTKTNTTQKMPAAK